MKFKITYLLFSVILVTDVSFCMDRTSGPQSTSMSRAHSNSILRLVCCTPMNELSNDELWCRTCAGVPCGAAGAAGAEAFTLWGLLSMGWGVTPAGMLGLIGITMCAGALPVGLGIGYSSQHREELSNREKIANQLSQLLVNNSDQDYSREN